METKLIALNANLEMVKAVVKEEEEKLKQELTDFVQSYIIQPTGAHLLRLHFRIGFDGDIEVNFEVGFQTPEGKVDFGSDCWFEYNSKGLSINHGTIGCWTKANIYQIKRIKMLSYVVDQIDTLETRFQEIMQAHELFVTKQDEAWSIQAEITQLENAAKRDNALKVLNSISIGTHLCYNEDFYLNWRLFVSGRSTRKGDVWTVTSVGEKTLTLVSENTATTRRVNKEKLLEHLKNASLQVF